MNHEKIIKKSIINKEKNSVLTVYGFLIFFVFCVNLLVFIFKCSKNNIGYLLFSLSMFIVNLALYLIYVKIINKSKLKYEIKNNLFIDLLLLFINCNVFYYRNDYLLFLNILIIIFSVIFCNKDLVQITLYKVIFINLIYFIIKFIDNLLSAEALKFFVIIHSFTILVYFISYVLLNVLFEQLNYISRVNNRQSILSKNLNKAVKDLKIEPLTGLFNKRAMYEAIETKINNLKYFNRESHLAIIDLDFFKRVNDTYGHIVGDEVLISLADLLKEKIRGES